APAGLSSGTVGTAYSDSVAAGGGTGPYSYSSGAGLPPGVTLSVSGALSGTPTTNGSFNFTVMATDSCGCSGSSNYTISVTCPAITVDPTNLPNGTIAVAYSATNSASGGTA